MKRLTYQVTCDVCRAEIGRTMPGTEGTYEVPVAIRGLVRRPDLCANCYRVLVAPLIRALYDLPEPALVGPRKKKRRRRV